MRFLDIYFSLAVYVSYDLFYNIELYVWFVVKGS